MLQDIKKSFFTYRNGIIADTLRKAGMPYKVIFGLQIPQIAAIAHDITPSMEIADELWADSEVRESRLLATYLYPREEVTAEKALSLMRSARTPEESDMLAFRLLKHLPFASDLVTDKDTPAFALASLKNHLNL